MKLIPHHQDDNGPREYRSPDGTWRVVRTRRPGGSRNARARWEVHERCEGRGAGWRHHAALERRRDALVFLDTTAPAGAGKHACGHRRRGARRQAKRRGGAEPLDRRRGRQDGSRASAGLNEPADQVLVRLRLFDASRLVSSDASPTLPEWAVTCSTPPARAAAWNCSLTIFGESGTTRTAGAGFAAALSVRIARATPPFTNRTSLTSPSWFVLLRRTVTSTPSPSAASATSAQRRALTSLRRIPAMKRSPAITASRRPRSSHRPDRSAASADTRPALCRAPLTTSPLADRPGGPPHPRLVGDGADAPSAPGRRNSPHPIASPAQARQLRPWPSDVDRPYATPFRPNGGSKHPGAAATAWSTPSG